MKKMSQVAKVSGCGGKIEQILAESCFYAQHSLDVGGNGATEMAKETRDIAWRSHSLVVACLLAKHTVKGVKGVDEGIVVKHLVQTHPTVGEWRVVIKRLADKLGGWNRRLECEA